MFQKKAQKPEEEMATYTHTHIHTYNFPELYLNLQEGLKMPKTLKEKLILTHS